jgi:hypothetical protein
MANAKHVGFFCMANVDDGGFFWIANVNDVDFFWVANVNDIGFFSMANVNDAEISLPMETLIDVVMFDHRAYFSRILYHCKNVAGFRYIFVPRSAKWHILAIF